MSRRRVEFVCMFHHKCINFLTFTCITHKNTQAVIAVFCQGSHCACKLEKRFCFGILHAAIVTVVEPV